MSSWWASLSSCCAQPVMDCMNKICKLVIGCGKKKFDDGESKKLIIASSNQPLPISISVEKVNQKREVPFAIPMNLMTPTSAAPSDEESAPGSLPATPMRSRASTMDASIMNIPLGELDASLYDDSEDATVHQYPPQHVGRLWYRLHYNHDTEKLQVEIIEAKNLPYKTVGPNLRQEFFVRVCIPPEDKRFAQTVRKRDVKNCMFEECFTFGIIQSQLDERCLKFILFKNTPAKKQQPIAFFFAPICPINKPKTSWMDFEPYDEENATMKKNNVGKLFVSLMYNQRLKKLFVEVFKCTLVNKELYQNSDAFLRLELMNQRKTAKTKKSHMFHISSEETEFDHTFKFSIPELCLPQTSVSITLIQVKLQNKQETCGKILLGGYTLAGGQELEHWQKMIDQPNQQHCKWHHLS